MALAVTIKQTSRIQNIIRVIFALVASGNYTQISGGGDPIDLTTGWQPGSMLPSQQPPLRCTIKGQAGYDYVYVPGTKPTNGALEVNTAAATELAAGAYPAGITGDTIVGEADFPILQ